MQFSFLTPSLPFPFLLCRYVSFATSSYFSLLRRIKYCGERGALWVIFTLFPFTFARNFNFNSNILLNFSQVHYAFY